MISGQRSWKEATASEGLKAYKAFVLERDKEVGAFLEFDPGRTVTGGASGPASGIAATGDLSGLPFAVKDNISVRNFHLTCGSKILQNFVSPYNATSIDRLVAAGAVPVGKTNLDEFGMGSSTDNSAFKTTNNPWDLTRVSGGSSGGSAAAVAAGLVAFSLGSDTGGSVRQPASFCGVYGLKPTYGAVSRYGLVAYASSLEVVGALAKELKILKSVFDAMKGPDVKDQTTIDLNETPQKTVKTIGVLKTDKALDPAVADSFAATVKALKDSGYSVVEIELPLLDYSVPSYYTIACAEASANLARFNGIRYGERPVYSENPDSLVRQARDAGFGAEVKLRVLLGTYVLRSGFQEQYYQRAQKIRTAIRDDFEKAFAAVDLIMMPVFPGPAFVHGDAGLDAFQQKLADKYTTALNLSGHPGLALPGPVVKGLPVGMQLLGPSLGEDLLFQVAEKLEGAFPAQQPPKYPAAYA